MIKFVHAADLHLDAPFHSLPPEQAAQLRAEQRQLLRKLTELCQAQKADLLLLSGDVLDSEHVYRETLDALHQSFAACGAEVFLAPGNHDPAAVCSVWRTQAWGERVHIFDRPQMESVELERLGCRVYGAGFVGMECQPLLTDFRVTDSAMVNLMVLHADVGQAQSPYNPVTRQQIADSGLDYLALGHIHSFSGVCRAGNTTYAWPGCTQGRGFDETGEKGVIVGQVGRGGCELEFVPLAGRRYEILPVCAGQEPLQAILSALPQDTEADCYRILLTGEAPPPDVPALESALRERFFSLQIRDMTTPPVELWAECGTDNLKGLFLQSLHDAVQETADEQERQLLCRAARLGLDLMDGREVALP